MDSLPMDHQRLVDFLTDDETSLLGKQYFLMRLEEEFKKSWRHGWSLSLIVVEIEGLEAIRENDGEHAYKQAVLGISGELLSASRDTDLSSRLDTKRFAVVLPGTDEVGAHAFVDRVLRNIIEGAFGQLTMAIGGTAAPQEGLTSTDEFIARAATGVDLARGKGTNEFVFWSAPSR